MHTACVVGKNYRLQDIQLSILFSLGPWPRGLASLAGTRCPAPFRSPLLSLGLSASRYHSKADSRVPPQPHESAASKVTCGFFQLTTRNLPCKLKPFGELANLG